MDTRFLPLFPLNLVVYPNERLNLHISEQRYLQLINECLEKRTSFGIPAYFDNKVQSYGTEMKINMLHQRYENGRMDIETEGLRVFKIRQFENPVVQKLYAGGTVEMLTIWGDPQGELVDKLMEKVRQLYELLESPLKLHVTDYDYLSYELAHKVGLSLAQEYKILTLTSEKERQKYLLKHLEQSIPVISNMERTKDRIRMNGHFRHIDPLNF